MNKILYNNIKTNFCKYLSNKSKNIIKININNDLLIHYKWKYNKNIKN